MYGSTVPEYAPLLRIDLGFLEHTHVSWFVKPCIYTLPQILKAQFSHEARVLFSIFFCSRLSANLLRNSAFSSSNGTSFKSVIMVSFQHIDWKP